MTSNSRRHRHPLHHHSSIAAGFTLVEIMVVVTILGLLATLVAINVVPASDEAREMKARTDVTTIRDAVRMFRQANGRLPTLDELTTPDQRGHLVFEELSRDPWGNDYVVREGVPPRAFEVVSSGPDGQLDTDDDIHSSRDNTR